MHMRLTQICGLGGTALGLSASLLGNDFTAATGVSSPGLSHSLVAAGTGVTSAAGALAGAALLGFLGLVADSLLAWRRQRLDEKLGVERPLLTTVYERERRRRCRTVGVLLGSALGAIAAGTILYPTISADVQSLNEAVRPRAAATPLALFPERADKSPAKALKTTPAP
jgi:hypothetical protein